jgi:hypothetical protein
LNDSNLITYSHGEYRLLGEYVGKFGVEATNVQVTVSSVINNETGNA